MPALGGTALKAGDEGRGQQKPPLRSSLKPTAPLPPASKEYRKTPPTIKPGPFERLPRDIWRADLARSAHHKSRSTKHVSISEVNETFVVPGLVASENASENSDDEESVEDSYPSPIPSPPNAIDALPWAAGTDKPETEADNESQDLLIPPPPTPPHRLNGHPAGFGSISKVVEEAEREEKEKQKEDEEVTPPDLHSSGLGSPGVASSVSRVSERSSDHKAEDSQSFDVFQRQELSKKIQRLVLIQRGCDARRETSLTMRREVAELRETTKKNLDEFQKIMAVLAMDERNVQMLRAARLAQKAMSAFNSMKKKEEKFNYAFKKLQSIEYKMEEREHEILDLLRPYDLELDDVDEVLSETESVSSVPSVGSVSEEGEETSPTMRYYETIGRIANLRERLPDLELRYQEQVRQGDRKLRTSNWRRLAYHEYYNNRTKTVRELLDLIDLASQLVKLCEKEGTKLEGTKESLEHALKYEVGRGDISHMYWLHWAKEHKGVRPIELLLVPHQYGTDRVPLWSLQTQAAISGMSAGEVEDQITTTYERMPFEFPEVEAVEDDDLEWTSTYHFEDRDSNLAMSAGALSKADPHRILWAGSCGPDTQSEPDADTGDYDDDDSDCNEGEVKSLWNRRRKKGVFKTLRHGRDFMSINLQQKHRRATQLPQSEVLPLALDLVVPL